MLEILEYWIVDPLLEQITVCKLNEGRYDDVVFKGDEVIESTLFTHLQWTVDQSLSK